MLNKQSNKARDRNSRVRGFSLHELAVYVTVLALLTSPLASVMVFSADSVSEADAVSTSQERNRVVIFRIADELRAAISTSIEVDTRSLTFTLPQGYDGTTMTPGDTIRYAIQSTDVNNADAPARLVRTNVTTNESVVLCETLDYNRAKFETSGAGVRITIVTSRATDRGDVSVSKSVTAFARN